MTATRSCDHALPAAPPPCRRTPPGSRHHNGSPRPGSCPRPGAASTRPNPSHRAARSQLSAGTCRPSGPTGYSRLLTDAQMRLQVAQRLFESAQDLDRLGVDQRPDTLGMDLPRDLVEVHSDAVDLDPEPPHLSSTR